MYYDDIIYAKFRQEASELAGVQKPVLLVCARTRALMGGLPSWALPGTLNQRFQAYSLDNCRVDTVF